MSIFDPAQLESAALKVIESEGIPADAKGAIVATASTHHGGELALVGMVRKGDRFVLSGVLGYTKDDGLAAGGKVKLTW